MAQLDSKKLEKLLSSATSERQRKMYQSLLQKARIQEQASKKSSSTTQTKNKSQAILGKVEKQEKAQAKSSSMAQSSPEKNKDNPPKVELAPDPVLEKPPVRQPPSTNLSSNNKAKTTTQTHQATTTDTNKDKKSEPASLSKTQSVSQEKKSQNQTKTAQAQETKKKTKKTFAEEEVPFFQALGKMILSPYLFENDLKVEINGQEYDLLSDDNFTSVAYKKLKQQLIQHGTRKMLLKLYPLVQFSDNSEKPKLSFILSGFENKPEQERKSSNYFQLRGIWQYVPFCQTPVISIYRNMRQLWQLKKLNEKEKFKFAEPHHIPVMWDDAPVAPYQYVAEKDTEEQKPCYFVEVRATLKDGVFVVQEMLREPTLNIPNHITAEKLKEYSLKQKKASSSNSENNQTSSEKDSSLPKKDSFQFVLRGEVKWENYSEFFQLENGVKFNIRSIIPEDYPQEIADWQALPVTDNDGQIVNLILEKPLSSTELMTTPSNLIIEAGRIIELGKKDDRFKVKVKREKAKDLKITALGKEPKMKVGQLWSMKLVLKEGSLYVQEAKYLQD